MVRMFWIDEFGGFSESAVSAAQALYLQQIVEYEIGSECWLIWPSA